MEGDWLPAEVSMIMDWREKLHRFFRSRTLEQTSPGAATAEHQRACQAYLTDVVVPSLETFSNELRALGRTVSISLQKHRARIVVKHLTRTEFEWAVESRCGPHGWAVYPVETVHRGKGKQIVEGRFDTPHCEAVHLLDILTASYIWRIRQPNH
ncbi:protein of unknown function [Methylococcus capsulatus]|jgi:hypothetical protein|uniref:Uncharacterized protein n=2 Tax=Methylococcus capsulatus TaxID=414 RepID=A0AA35XXZ6_METCP|nr:protein of unknown function [Methylococcus capsulatus]